MASKSHHKRQGYNLRKIFFVLGIVILLLYGFYMFSSRPTNHMVHHYHSWKVNDYIPIPKSILESSKQIEIKSSFITFSLPSNKKVTDFVFFVEIYD